jgi:hypothetical protein
MPWLAARVLLVVAVGLALLAACRRQEPPPPKTAVLPISVTAPTDLS